ncbi:RloB family protein [Corynebacterium sp. UMB10119B.1]|uniref:RloB family protein n=1 Tax=Corynebacterium sp. UMB10119B.1 TaxID=3050601 RepID=UPI00254FB3BB|nr:RloB family protein [Corynebacterium sp. UMB10119B]MDK8364632.1 RloB family protein [Corynebacterium sp. UMB10119B]
MAARKGTPRKPKSRAKRKLKSRLLIVVEGDKGKSEQVYFQRLAQILRSNDVATDIKVVPSKGEPKRVLDTCENHLKSDNFDRAFLVVDCDQHTTLGDVLQLAQKSNISVAVTNPQFEQWLYWRLYDGGSDAKKMTDVLQKERYLTGRNAKELGVTFPVERYPEATARAKRHWTEMRPNAPMQKGHARHLQSRTL